MPRPNRPVSASNVSRKLGALSIRSLPNRSLYLNSAPTTGLANAMIPITIQPAFLMSFPPGDVDNAPHPDRMRTIATSRGVYPRASEGRVESDHSQENHYERN